MQAHCIHTFIQVLCAIRVPGSDRQRYAHKNRTSATKSTNSNEDGKPAASESLTGASWHPKFSNSKLIGSSQVRWIIADPVRNDPTHNIPKKMGWDSRTQGRFRLQYVHIPAQRGRNIEMAAIPYIHPRTTLLDKFISSYTLCCGGGHVDPSA